MGRDLNKKTKLTIGRLARASGVGVSTVRYYQKRGLLRQPERPAASTFRSYAQSDLKRLHLIRFAQELGFTLAEIAELVEYVDSKDCRSITALATRKLHGIRTQIKLLQNTRRTLSSLISDCRHDDCEQCPLLQTLERRTASSADDE